MEKRGLIPFPLYATSGYSHTNPGNQLSLPPASSWHCENEAYNISSTYSEIPEIMSAYPESQRRQKFREWLELRLLSTNVEFEVVLGAVRVRYKPDRLKWEY